MNERLAMDDGAASERLGLSVLMDGEGSPAEAAAWCKRWAGDASARADWHAFHLIGDVMRSDELAGLGDDGAFLAKLQQRLAEEPTVMAPLPAAEPPPARRRSSMRRWSAPLGAAAGVALVAGTVWVARPQWMDRYPSGALARNGAAESNANHEAALQFERYLSAHKQFQPAVAVSPGSGFVRSAIYDANDR